MLKTLLLAIEFLSAFILIITILMHSPKSEGMGAIGGQSRMFGGAKGMEAGLTRVTMILGVVFLVTALLLSILY